MDSQNFYILVPSLPHSLSPQKRKAPSPSPSGSDTSSRAPSPNLSPTKRIRRDKDVDVATSGLSAFDLTNRPKSPTVSDFAGPTLYSGEGEDAQSLSLEDDRNSSVIFQCNQEYASEASCPDLLRESGGKGLPIRRLRNFTIFRSDNLRLISAMELLHPDLSDGRYSASGIVESVTEDDDDTSESSEDEDDSETRSSGVPVKLLTIIELDVHDFDDGELNENIFIKTERAWYILDTPSALYESFWKPLWLQHQFAHLVLMSSLDEPRTTMAQFIDSLNSEESEVLTESAFKSDDVIAYITGAIEQVLAADAPIARVPLIRSLIDRPVLPPIEHESRAAPKVAKGVKKADTVPLVTPIIKRVLDKHLNSPMCLVGAEYEEANEAIANELRDAIEHHHDPKSMQWKECQGKYSGVEMDGVVYEIGDVVAVAPGNDNNADRTDSELFASQHCVNKFANNVWFIRIMYFYDHSIDRDHNKPRKMLHGQWLTHGSRTILQETPHSQELFLLNECDGIAVASIFSKCTVRFLELGETEEPDKSDPDARNFFCRYLYDDEEHSFTDPPSVPPDTQCPNCWRKSQARLYNRPRIVDDGLALHGRTYHVEDYVYVKPNSEKKGLVLFVARITKINCGKNDIVIGPGVTLKPRQLRVRHYQRAEDDPRRIYRTSSTNCVDAEDLDGLFFVRPFDLDQGAERDAWIDAHPDRFYITGDAEDEFKRCEDCFQKHLAEVEEIESLPLRFGEPLPVLEVFSGAGGLSQGLDQSGFFQTKWAVERSVPAAKTFALNHPETKVLCTDINDLLQYSAELRYGKGTPSPLQSSDTPPTIIPDAWIPRMGEPGLVCGGPPCQSFSGANSHKKENDPRSSLPFTMLSVAEVYEPNFFLLENVTGLLQHSVTSKTGDGRLVEKAMLKLIIRGLIALDYQARFKVLQAGQYGSPQDRQRLIFFGAKRGCKLPEFPIPTHAFSKPAKKYQLFIQNDHIPPAKRGRGPDDDHIFAPHASVTINDAIGDLCRYDWINPHILRPKTSADVARVADRIAQGIQQMDSSTAPVGFVDPVAYATPPTTRYQRAMRRDQTKVEYHYTSQASPFVTEASATVPLKPYSNQNSLPEEFFVNRKLKKGRPICFGRLDNDEYFKTAVTTVQPRSRGSYVLHPDQYRAISVLEAKRAQGFPDSYTLWSGATKWTGRIADYYRHIGNAVPVPLAAALGRSLEAAFVETWRRMPKESSPEL
ncbi:S-adenosyl-L-methionine-dependent methyltransferase [Mycena haematopus]|nr:S-adenosyl-L-methionine-dependent methyltransferase [Mycena haematopus]